ncbi:MAG TPA: hypothetical protein O0X73_04695 [Methanocorpusculum sp.]|nr:hypothetical protein [Methanocorpusculum sp.]
MREPYASAQTIRLLAVIILDAISYVLLDKQARRTFSAIVQ